MTGSGDEHDGTETHRTRFKKAHNSAARRRLGEADAVPSKQSSPTSGEPAIDSAQLETLRSTMEEMLSSYIPDKSLRRAVSVVAAHKAKKILVPHEWPAPKSVADEYGNVGLRVRSTDPVDGFKARQKAYRVLFKDLTGNRPGILGGDDYTPVDFLNEEWGDLIREGHLTSSILIKDDYVLYRLLVDYVRGVKKGSYNRQPNPDASLDTLLAGPKKSVREHLRERLGKASKLSAEAAGPRLG